MLISVIVPTFNRSYWITNTIQSILKQTYSNIEIIVVDDGSIDNTRNIIDDIKKTTNAIIKYYWKPNEGCASARNLGLIKAKGDYIAFLDSDDQLISTALEKLYMTLLSNPKSDFVYSPSIEIYENGVEKIHLPAGAYSPAIFATEHFKTFDVRPGSVLYKKKIFKKVHGFNEDLKYNEDSEFLQRVAILFKASYCPTPSVKVYSHKNNKSKNRVEIYKAAIKSIKKIEKDYPKFIDSIKEIRDKRYIELNNNLAEALILKSNYDEAIEIINKIKNKARLSLILSSAIKSKLPLIFIRSVRNYITS